MRTLKTELLKAGFKESSPKKKKLTVNQCDCGAILSKQGRCLICDGVTRIILRK